MTATDAAPDPAAAEKRWQDLLDRIHDLEARMAANTSTVNAALDHHLARLDALRHHLACPNWSLPAAATRFRACGEAGLGPDPGSDPSSGPDSLPGPDPHPAGDEESWRTQLIQA